MNRQVHVRICGSRGVKLPPATRPPATRQEHVDVSGSYEACLQDPPTEHPLGAEDTFEAYSQPTR